MTKTEIVEKVSKDTKVSKAELSRIFELLFREIERTVATGEPVHFKGFGTFENKVRSERYGQNFVTKEKVYIPEANYPKFTPSKKFKKTVAGEPLL